MQEVGGSIPPGSTRFFRPASPSSRGLGHIPFTDATGVRIPVGTPLEEELFVVDRSLPIRPGLLRALAFALVLTPAAAFADSHLTPYAIEAIAHNSNVFDLPANGTIPIPPGSSTPTLADTTYRSSLGLDAAYQWGQQKFFGIGEVRRVDYRNFTTLNHNESLLSGGLDWKLGHLFDGVISYSHERRMVQFKDLQDATTLYIETANVASASANIHVTPEWQVQNLATDQRLDSPRPGAPQLSLHEVSIKEGLRYGGFANLSAGFDLEYVNGKFRNDPLALTPNFHQFSELLAASYRVAAHTKFNSTLGYTRRSNQNAAGNSADVSAVTGSLEYLRNLTGKTSLEVKLERDVNSYVTTAGSEVDTSGGFAVNWLATPKIAVRAGYKWTQSKYPPIAAPGGVPGRDDHFQTANLEATYQVFHWISIRAYANHQSRNSNLGNFVFNATVYGVEFQARRPQYN